MPTKDLKPVDDKRIDKRKPYQSYLFNIQDIFSIKVPEVYCLNLFTNLQDNILNQTIYHQNFCILSHYNLLDQLQQEAFEPFLLFYF